MKLQTILFTLLLVTFLSTCGRAQTLLEGRIQDAQSGGAIAFANIGVVGRGVGTVSDAEGNFSLRIRDQYDDAPLRVSILGYESFNGKVSAFRELIKKQKVIKLKPLSYDLEQIEVVPAFSKTKRFGNEAVSRGFTDGFDGDLLGREGGIVVKLGKRFRPGVLTKFSVYVVNNPYAEIKFRLNFYSLEKGLPGKPLSREGIIISRALLHEDLSLTT